MCLLIDNGIVFLEAFVLGGDSRSFKETSTATEHRVKYVDVSRQWKLKGISKGAKNAEQVADDIPTVWSVALFPPNQSAIDGSSRM